MSLEKKYQKINMKPHSQFVERFLLQNCTPKGELIMLFRALVALGDAFGAKLMLKIPKSAQNVGFGIGLGVKSELKLL